MKIRLSDLWRWDGTIDRGAYALLGVLLFGIKHNLDRFIAALYGRPWGLFNYLPIDEAFDPWSMSRDDLRFYSTLLATAIPFIFLGTALTLRRLRAARLPLWLVVLFFMPFVNLAFFVVLSTLPSRSADGSTGPLPRETKFKRYFDRLIPDHPVGSAAMAVALTLPFALGGTYLSVNVLGKYGWGLFVGLPFCLGLCSVLLYGYHARRGLGSCILVSGLACVFLGLVIAGIALEGIICLVMAAPIMIVLSMIGGLIGYAIQSRPRMSPEVPAILGALVVFLPAVLGAEYTSRAEPPLVAVTTAVEIDAPPERVWRDVVEFSELPPPDNWIFDTGVAYPVRAEIEGRGVGAVRRCVFSTGAFVEPIDVWDEPHLLKFSVVAQPPAMKELSYADIQPPHLDNYLQSRGGQFLLEPLPGGRTRLEGTTWYENRMWPSPYWQQWSDLIIHRIHLRVLDHVKRLAEAGGS